MFRKFLDLKWELSFVGGLLTGEVKTQNGNLYCSHSPAADQPGHPMGIHWLKTSEIRFMVFTTEDHQFRSL